MPQERKAKLLLIILMAKEHIIFKWLVNQHGVCLQLLQSVIFYQ